MIGFLLSGDEFRIIYNLFSKLVQTVHFIEHTETGKIQIFVKYGKKLLSKQNPSADSRSQVVRSKIPFNVGSPRNVRCVIKVSSILLAANCSKHWTLPAAKTP